MKNHNIIALVVTCGLVALIATYSLFGRPSYQYVRGRYGKICYIKGHESKEIRYPVYFKTLDDCKNSI
jgi:hypothetical protein